MYFAGQHHQHGLHSSHPPHHSGRSRRAARASGSQNNNHHKRMTALRIQKEAEETALEKAYRREFDAARSFDLEDDELFCPFHLLTEDDVGQLFLAPVAPEKPEEPAKPSNPPAPMRPEFVIIGVPEVTTRWITITHPLCILLLHVAYLFEKTQRKLSFDALFEMGLPSLPKLVYLSADCPHPFTHALREIYFANREQLQSIHTAGSDRSSLSSGSPEQSPLQQQIQPTSQFLLPPSTGNFTPQVFVQPATAASQTTKIHQPLAQRTRNAIPIVDPTTRAVASPPPSVSPARQMQAQYMTGRRW